MCSIQREKLLRQSIIFIKSHYILNRSARNCFFASTSVVTTTAGGAPFVVVVVGGGVVVVDGGGGGVVESLDACDN